MSLHKYLHPGEHPYPHIGNLMSKVLREKGWAKTDLCTALGISPSGVNVYCQRPSVQTGILWNAGLALKHDFFADLSAAFPYPPEANNPLQKRIAELERELEIYKSIVHNRP